MIQLLFMFLVIGVLAWIAGAASASLLSRWSPETVSPAQRLQATVFVALLPWLLPVTWIAALGSVAAGKRFGWLDDHCPIHADTHAHFCFEHFPALHIDPWTTAVLGLLMLALAVIPFRHVIGALDRRRRLNALLRLLPQSGLLRHMDGARPLALVARPLRPVLLISRGMLDGLSRRERRVVLAHEAAHLRHGDLLKSALFEFLLAIHLPATAARLRGCWRQGIEERADDLVSQRFGHMVTAQTLLKVVRQQRFPETAGLAASGANVAQRIERLLDREDHPGGSSRWRAGFPAALALTLALGSAVPLAGAHHAIETLIGAILGG